jgi:hypothetical protein
MKKFTILSVILIALAINTKSQIPNSGFEMWTFMGNVAFPTGWWVSNDSVGYFESYYPVTESVDHYPYNIGAFSMRLESDPTQTNMWARAGVAWPGTWKGNNYPSFPVIGHPKALCGYYKYFPQNGDTMDIHWVIYNKGIELNQGKFRNSKTVSEWSPFKIYLNDTNYVSADSARIMITSASINDNPFESHGNSVLYVDNLGFDIFLSTDNLNNKINNHLLNLYPNPANDKVNIEFLENYFTKNSSIFIYNIQGELIYKSLINRSSYKQINISDYKAGVYFVKVADDLNVNIIKLIKE